MLRPVRFLASYPPYNRGEIAGFPDAEAERLIDAKIAEPLVALVDAPVVKPTPKTRTKAEG